MTARALPRLLKGLTPNGRPLSLGEHTAQHGPLPTPGRGRAHENMVEIIRTSGLGGRGGAGFPAAQKMASVAGRRGTKIVVANGAEGEPASAKDRVLMERCPHLVLDGIQVAAAAVGARKLFIATRPELSVRVERAVREREAYGVDAIVPSVVQVPDRFISGESSALVNLLNGGPGLPTTVPPRPDEKGVYGRPTLVLNVETLAHMALIARHGAYWFRALGTLREPGSTLVTARGALRYPAVYEVSRGTPVSQLVEMAGGLTVPVQAFLLGGYGGTWVTAADAWSAPLSEEGLAPVGGAMGVGLVFAFPEHACGVAETARILGYLARASARQCGPCTNGLPAMASAMADLARGVAGRGVVQQLEMWAWQVAGRGACRHPDGAVRMMASALTAFSVDVARHRDRRACATVEAGQPTGPGIAKVGKL